MAKEIKDKPIEIFGGTGGVGKTTLAVSRALHLAFKKKKVLLITIDPAQRLKDLLNLKEEKAGEVSLIDPDIWGSKNLKLLGDHYQVDPLNSSEHGQLHAMLMSPMATLKKIGLLENNSDFSTSNIVQILSRPHGGMNEILSLVELQHHWAEGKYDCIILDTPPGRHLVDFLNSSRRIENFLQSRFIEVFQYLEKKFKEMKGLSQTRNFLTQILSTGIDKLFGYLEQVTGPIFIQESIHTICAI
ncbi:MAG: ArsA-related P-loop ATPase, partial [Pseudomonadota bacterium]